MASCDPISHDGVENGCSHNGLRLSLAHPALAECHVPVLFSLRSGAR